MANLIEELENQKTSHDDKVWPLSFEHRKRILVALKAAKWNFDQVKYRCNKDPDYCLACQNRDAFHEALNGEEPERVEVESSANVPPKKEWAGKGRIVDGEKERKR